MENKTAKAEYKHREVEVTVQCPHCYMTNVHYFEYAGEFKGENFECDYCNKEYTLEN